MWATVIKKKKYPDDIPCTEKDKKVIMSMYQCNCPGLLNSSAVNCVYFCYNIACDYKKMVNVLMLAKSDLLILVILLKRA